MCSSHAPTHGADSEWANPLDYACDMCARTVYRGRLYPWNSRRLCAECAVRESGEPACSYCDGPTFGDYRRFTFGQSVGIACGACTDKWAERYEEEVAS